MMIIMTKYHAKRTEVDGIKFASRKEANRYQELCLLEKAGEISHLILQPVWKLVVNEMLICKYIADFQYCTEAGDVITEDCKGVLTPVYRLKKKLMKAVYGIEILET